MSLLKIGALVTVVCMVGCAGGRELTMPVSPDIDSDQSPRLEEVRTGIPVKIALINGDFILGEVVEADATQLVVRRSGNYGTEEIVVLAVDIRRVESQYHGTGAGKLIAPVFIGTIAALAAIAGWAALFHQ